MYSLLFGSAYSLLTFSDDEKKKNYCYIVKVLVNICKRHFFMRTIFIEVHNIWLRRTSIIIIIIIITIILSKVPIWYINIEVIVVTFQKTLKDSPKSLHFKQYYHHYQFQCNYRPGITQRLTLTFDDHIIRAPSRQS